MTKSTSKTNKDTTAHEAWFLKLSPKDYLELCKAWNSQHLGINLPKESKDWNYDDFFDFFRTQPSTAVRKLQSTGGDILSIEAFSALRRWIDIVESPHRIEKIHATALKKERDKDKKTLLEMAHADDTVGVLEGVRDDLIIESEKASPKDKPNYSRSIMELMEQINEVKRRQAPSKDTYLGKLLNDSQQIRIAKERPKQNGGGADKQSFRSRITIEDVEKS